MSDTEKVERRTSKSVKKKRKSNATDSITMPTTSDDEWLKTKNLITTNFDILANTEDNCEERCNLILSIRNTVNLITESLKTITKISLTFGELLQTLLKLLKYDKVDIQIRFNIVDIMLTLSGKEVLKLTPADDVTILRFLMKSCPSRTSEKHTTIFIRKLRKLANKIHENEDLKAYCIIQKDVIMPDFKDLLHNVRFCVSELGKDIVGDLTSVHESFTREFHTYVKRLLINCHKSEALIIGKIYYRIWDRTEDDFRKVIEEDCIQWFMEKAFTIGREENTVKFLSSNLQSLLKGLHCSRKPAKFSKAITNLYTPLLWKFLNCDNKIHRCNAAEIFIDVYPLERPGEGQAVYSRFLRKQHDEMMNLLDDPCPTIRAIAIKGICANMKYFWITFQNGTAQQVLKKLITDMIQDGSSYEVRKSVYLGLMQLFEEPASHTLLKGVLPSLDRFLHDENQSVRQAFLRMLLTIKNTQSEIKYYQIVNLENVAARLENENSANRQLIVNLIFSSFIGPKIEIEDSIKRLCKFTSISPNACRFLAMHSKELMKLEQACTIMCMILIIISNHLKKKLETNDDENRSSEENKKPEKIRRKRNDDALKSIENVPEEDESSQVEVDVSSSTTSSDGPRKLTSISNPDIAHGLLDFVSALWLIYGKKLMEPENKEYLEKLHSCGIKCINLATRYFKGTHAIFGVIYLAGMIPLSKLQYTSTVIGSCVSMLKHFSNASHVNEYHCVIHVLSLWNRGVDVIELIKEWLDEAFRTQNLNESYFTKGTKPTKRVKFVKHEAKPTFALAVLNEIFSSPPDQQCIFSKNSQELLDLWNCLKKVKTLITKRIQKGEELSEQLNDEFLKKALDMYGCMIILFNENSVPNFSFSKNMADYFRWADETLGEGNKVDENVDEALKKFLGDMLQAPLSLCTTLVALGKHNDQQISFLCAFCNTALNSASGLYCIEPVLKFVKQLLLFTKAHHKSNRDNNLATEWCPQLLDTILSLLTDKIYTQEVLCRHINDLVSLRKDLVFIYLLVTKLYPKLHHSGLSHYLMKSFCKHLINIVLFPIRECETLNVDQSIKNLPFIGSLLAAVLISQEDLASGFLFVLQNIISEYTGKDALNLLATASLLYTLAFTKGKIKKIEILKVVKKAYNQLGNLTTEEGCLALVMNHEQTIGERTIIDIEDTNELAVKEIGKHILKMIIEHFGGSMS